MDARKTVISVEIEALYEALKERIAGLARLEEELEEPKENLRYARLVLAGIASSLKKVLENLERGQTVTASVEACSLSLTLNRIITGQMESTGRSILESSRALLVAIKNVADVLCEG